MICAVMLIQFILNINDDDQSVSCSFAVLNKQVDTVLKKLKKEKREKRSDKELKSSCRVKKS